MRRRPLPDRLVDQVDVVDPERDRGEAALAQIEFATDSPLEEKRFEPSVPLAVKTPLGHTFRRPLAVRQQSRGARWRLSAMSLIVCANISQRICAIAPSRAPDARAIFGHVT
jgi:hypothetical protein